MVFAPHTDREVPKQDVPQRPVIDHFPVLQPVQSYAGVINAINQSFYIYFDQALQDSQANSLAMRRDPFIDEILRHRQMPVVCLPHHIEVDDPDHPEQKSIGETLHKMICGIPHFKLMLLNLLESIFYGKAGVQVQYGTRKIAGNSWNIPVSHYPVNGDKLRYKFDGTPGVALRSGVQFDESRPEFAYLNAFKSSVDSSMLGQALWLDNPFLRDRFIIHMFETSDSDYLFELESALSMYGLGKRSRLYWGWQLRMELLSWMTDALQRVGANGMIFGMYPEGNASAQSTMMQAVQMLCKDNAAVFPVFTQNNNWKDIIQRIEPSAVGYDVMFNLIQHLEGIMRRDMLGQDLSSESKPTGIGGGAAKLQGNVRSDYIEYDATMLDETLDQDLLGPVLKYNQFKYEGQIYYGCDLPFSSRFRHQITRENVGEAIQAAKTMYDMGIEMDKDDIRTKSGFSPPKKKATALINPAIKAQEQQNAAGVPDMNATSAKMKGVTDAARQGNAAMKGGQPGLPAPSRSRSLDVTRLARESGDCGHDDGGQFSRGNTCATGSRKQVSEEDSDRSRLADASRRIFGRDVDAGMVGSLAGIDFLHGIGDGFRSKVTTDSRVYKTESGDKVRPEITVATRSGSAHTRTNIGGEPDSVVVTTERLDFATDDPEHASRMTGAYAANQIAAALADPGIKWLAVEPSARKQGVLPADQSVLVEMGYDGKIPPSVRSEHGGEIARLSLPDDVRPDKIGRMKVDPDAENTELKNFRKKFPDAEITRIPITKAIRDKVMGHLDHWRRSGLKDELGKVRSILSSDSHPPPIVSFYDSKNVGIPDGFHRIAAYVLAGRNSIDGYVDRGEVPGMADAVRGRSPQISDLIATPEGKTFWERHGKRTTLEFDASKGSASRRRFEAWKEGRKAGPSRFAKAGASDDCGHDPSGGFFSLKNTCQTKRKGKPAARTIPRESKNEPSGGFTLRQESASGRKPFKTENTGAGRTGRLFDMKKGDLPGQSSIMDREEDKPSVRDRDDQRSRTAQHLRELRHRRNVERSPEVHARPGEHADVRVEHIAVDPERFQFKIGHAAGTGSVGSLAGVKKYDPELAGAVSVWRDPEDGKTYVVNGHNRLDLAKRLGVDKIHVKYLGASTPEEARAKGAITNIAEGRGTSIDAAKFFRDTGIGREDVAAMGVPLREKVASEGLDMARLESGLFRKVIDGDLSPARASIIGGSGLSHAQQKDLYSQLDKMGRRGEVSDRTLRELVDNARTAGSRTRQGFDLFGSHEDEQSLAIHRAQVQSSIKSELSREKRLFGLVSQSKAAQELAEKGRSSIDVETTGQVSQEAAGLLAVFDTLKNRSGPVSAALNRAAERIADGEPRQKVIRDARGQIARAIESFFGSNEAIAS